MGLKPGLPQSFCLVGDAEKASPGRCLHPAPLPRHQPRGEVGLSPVTVLHLAVTVLHLAGSSCPLLQDFSPQSALTLSENITQSVGRLVKPAVSS